MNVLESKQCVKLREGIASQPGGYKTVLNSSLLKDQPYRKDVPLMSAIAMV